jgi:hypothetical protein
MSILVYDSQTENIVNHIFCHGTLHDQAIKRGKGSYYKDLKLRSLEEEREALLEYPRKPRLAYKKGKSKRFSLVGSRRDAQRRHVSC